MSAITQEELKNLKKLINNIEKLIKLNVDFKNRLERNSKTSVNITSNILKKHTKKQKRVKKSKSKSKSKNI